MSEVKTLVMKNFDAHTFNSKQKEFNETPNADFLFKLGASNRAKHVGIAKRMIVKCNYFFYIQEKSWPIESYIK